MMALKICYLLFILFLAYHINEIKAQATDQCLGDVCDGNLIVKIRNGVLRGKDNKFYYSYESIPYAEPPIGELRFENPLKYTQKWNGIFDATKEPKTCLQYDQFPATAVNDHGEEDCLTVNVYRPKYVEESLPVLVLIHGGAFMFGSVLHNGHDRLMQSGRLVVVKITYRLGPLGFLSTEDDVISGNFGLKDQRLALEWVKENIIHFGGDPERIMITGFSAGGASVHLQMLQPSLKEIVNVAGSFSGTALNPWVIIQKPRKNAFKLAEVLGCQPRETSSEIKKCLQEKSAKEIVQAVKQFLVFGYNPFTTFGPVIENSSSDQAFLTKEPRDIIISEEYAKIPWFASYTKEDGAYNSAELMKKSANGKELIDELNDLWYIVAPDALFFRHAFDSEEEVLEYAKHLKEKYLGEAALSTETYPKVLTMYTDIIFKNGVEEAVRLHSIHGQTPVYSYVYSNPADKGCGHALAGRDDVDFGTAHGDDFFLLFFNSVRNEILREDEAVNAKKFVKMVEDFVYTNGKLSYGSCDFVDNTGQEKLQLMFIGKDSCENKALDSYP